MNDDIITEEYAKQRISEILSSLSEKDNEVIKRILSLEKSNNRNPHFNNQEMIARIIEYIRKGIDENEI